MTPLLAALIWAAPIAQAKPPEVNALFPAGGSPGQEVEVIASGSFDSWPVKVWVDEPGVVLTPKDEKGKFTARVASDAVPGPRVLRFYSDRGASAPRAFVVGTIAETTEAEPNDGPEAVQAVEKLPALVNGKLEKRNDVDNFRVTLSKGQTLFARLDARSIGSPMDGVIQVIGPGGFVAEQVDDGPLLDPYVAHTASADGPHVIRVFAFPSTPDSSINFAGGDAFVYRLTVTTGPAPVGLAMPLTVDREGPGLVEPLGWNLPESARLRVSPTSRPGIGRAWNSEWPGVLELPMVAGPSPVEPSREPGAAPPALASPGRISGRLGAPGEEDRYRVALAKGKAVRFRITARAMGSWLDPVLRIQDAEGKTLAEQDDSTGADAELMFTPPSDGAFDVVVSDLTGQGGPLGVYLLEAIEPRPDFAVTLGLDRVAVEPGKTAEVPVSLDRRDGYDQPIEVRVVGLPPGVKAVAVVSEPKGDSRGKVALKLEGDVGSPPFFGTVYVVGRSGEVERPARAAAIEGGELAVDLWVTVVPAEGK